MTIVATIGKKSGDAFKPKIEIITASLSQAAIANNADFDQDLVLRSGKFMGAFAVITAATSELVDVMTIETTGGPALAVGDVITALTVRLANRSGGANTITVLVTVLMEHDN